MQERPSTDYNQAAVIPFGRRGSDYEVLLITTRSGKHWGVPKGVVERGLTPLQAAVQEAREEAGLEGEAYPDSIGMFQYEKWGGTCTVEVYVMRVHKVLSSWMEDFRQREWVRLPEAIDRIDDQPGLQDLLRALPDFVENLPEVTNG